MSRILCAWELGMGLGHLGALKPVGVTLRDLGHEVAFVLRDLSRAEMMLGSEGFALLQAPHWLPEVDGLALPLSYPQVLMDCGYLHATFLTGLVKAWQELYRLYRPQLVIADHSPTALVAARIQSIPALAFGNGFAVPPAQSPMPAIRPRPGLSEQQLLDSERGVLKVVNEVVEQLGGVPLDSFAELFSPERSALCTFAELDHYSSRDNGHYYGPVFTEGQSDQPPRWPFGDKARIFVYVYPDYPYRERLFKDLLALKEAVVLIYAPGISARLMNEYQAAHIAVTDRPVDLARVASECDLAIHHGGHGTTAAMLLAGKPLLLLPLHWEHTLLAQKVDALGAGLYVKTEASGANFRKPIKRLLDGESFTGAAALLARKYAASSPAATLEQLARKCESLLAHSRD